MTRQICEWTGTWTPGQSSAPLPFFSPRQPPTREWRPQGPLWIADVVLSKELWDCIPQIFVNGVPYELVLTSKVAWYRFTPKRGMPRNLTYRFGCHYLPVGHGDVVTTLLDNPTGHDIEGQLKLFGVDELESDQWLD